MNDKPMPDNPMICPACMNRDEPDVVLRKPSRSFCSTCGGVGYVEAPATPDGLPHGFRPRKVRPKGWLKQAIKDGSVRDPSLPPEPEQVYPEDAAVIQPPTATITQDEEN